VSPRMMAGDAERVQDSPYAGQEQRPSQAPCQEGERRKERISRNSSRLRKGQSCARGSSQTDRESKAPVRRAPWRATPSSRGSADAGRPSTQQRRGSTPSDRARKKTEGTHRDTALSMKPGDRAGVTTGGRHREHGYHDQQQKSAATPSPTWPTGIARRAQSRQPCPRLPAAPRSRGSARLRAAFERLGWHGGHFGAPPISVTKSIRRDGPN